jgi:hypothetical protein
VLLHIELHIEAGLPKGELDCPLLFCVSRFRDKSKASYIGFDLHPHAASHGISITLAYALAEALYIAQ